MNTSSRKWFNRIFKGASLATVAMAFQACYGAPRDFGMDQYIDGVVLSAEGEPLQGVLVSIDDTIQHTQTDAEGKFQFYISRKDEYKLSFSDDKGNNLNKDTTLTDRRGGIHLTINVEK
ncbi:MAG: carboxypeptidase-like regulatory domain-containing protein [Prevotella sp.]|jgi:hypothetical protein|nr:carboxypeptidase-like regulatory domain-containing protein [Prevotella sp.]